MIDKEKLLEVKNNLERNDECYGRVLEKTKQDQRHNELLLTLVNNELHAMEEVEKVKFEPWRKRIIDKAFDEFHQEHEPLRAELDGLTDYMKKDKEYSVEEFEEKVLDPYTEVFKRIKETGKDERGSSKHYLIMNDLKKDLALKESSLQRHTEGMAIVNASARRAEAMGSVEVSDKDKGRDRSFASFLTKYWIGNNGEGTEEVSGDTFTKVIEKLVNTKPISNKDEDMVTSEDKKVWKKNKSYDAVTAKIKEGKELDQSEINSLFKPCYEIECAIVDILKKHKTLKLKDIVYFVEQKDLDFESKHIYGFVQSVLNRSERFEKVSYGHWRLKKEEGETREAKPDSKDEEDSIAESTVMSIVRPKWNGVISYVDKLGVVNKIQQK